VAQKRKRKVVGVEELRKVYTIFSDTKRSMDYLNEQSDLYMYHQTGMEIEG
jgi:DNA helicase TIP49 (TBP-interacting protein)